MKIQELKAEVRSSWEVANLTDGTPTVDSLFKTEIRKFGDLRRKATWEAAAIALEARWLLGGAENRDLVEYFCAPDTPVGLEYNQEVLDYVLAHKDGLERIKNGLESLYLTPITPNDREYALSFLKRISGYEEIPDLALPMLALAAA